jgi:hypothetical protein
MREIPLTQGRVALVDDDQYDRVVARGKWCAVHVSKKYWYAAHRDAGCNILYMHRFITGVDSPHTDHKNGDGLDNQRTNLRPCTVAQNNCNRRGLPSHNTNGYMGVGLGMTPGTWVAKRKSKGHQYHGGTFDDIVSAAHASDVLAVRVHGEFAALNFPEDRESITRILSSDS